MSILEFFHQHDFLAFIAIILFMGVIGKCGIEIITLFKMPFRSYMVAKAGWPPEYLDADGDTHHKPTESNVDSLKSTLDKDACVKQNANDFKQPSDGQP